jgi:choline kinase
MKALITCAGMGTRLGILTEKTNKTLLKLNGKMIIEVILDILDRYNIKNKDTVVIGGHAYNKVEEVLKDKVNLIYNPFYQISGILCSIWFARGYLEQEEFVFITGDSIFHPSILELCIEKDGDIVVCVDKKKCDAEDSKVIIKNEEIIDLGKNIAPHKATGEFIGMLKVSKNASKAFFKEVDLILKETRLNSYVSDLLLRLKNKGIRLLPVYTQNYPRIEIDYPKDLEIGKEIYTEHIKPILYP